MSKFIGKMDFEEFNIPTNFEKKKKFFIDMKNKGNFILRIRNLSFTDKVRTQFNCPEFEKVFYLEGCDFIGDIIRIYFIGEDIYHFQTHIKVNFSIFLLLIYYIYIYHNLCYYRWIMFIFLKKYLYAKYFLIQQRMY